MSNLNMSVFVKSIIAALFSLFVTTYAFADDTGTLEIWKDPNCGCCKAWVDHMQAAGFKVRVHDTGQVQDVKVMNKVPEKLMSCHTAKIGNYIIEGHVPASDVIKLLKEKPEIHGLAVPGMPVGSPGMEVSSGEKDAYEVLSFDDQGNTAVYSSHN